MFSNMGTSNNSSHIMTLVNSIIGVSILAMPFCYKQCGILLASLILIFSNLMTRLSCHYLLKSAIMTRRRTYELLAFHALGGSGKTAVELSIILLMIGTCIAFFVVMGDLGPAIIGPLMRVEYSAALRPGVLVGIAVFVVLPLGMLRNVDSLSSICTASFLFYLLLVVKVFIESMDNLFSSPWYDEVYFWRPAGILQCLPIFSMALSCQTQLLEIFDSVQNGTLDKMNSIVKSAVNLCTALYMSVGFLGYVAYYKTSFTGNLLMTFSTSQFSEFIKLGFVLSVAVTFPLVIFPCRTSLHSLLFKKVHTPHYELVTGGGNHIPEAQFKCITFFIITSSLIVGLLAPNIEVVLGLLGSTIGVIICVLCPPFIFMCISNKATTEKILARIMCIFGLFIMVMGTYANLYLSDSTTNTESAQNWKNVDANIMKVPVDVAVKLLEEKNLANIVQSNDLKAPPNVDANNAPKSRQQKSKDVEAKNEEIALPIANERKEEDKRIEPPIPQDPEARKAPAAEQKGDMEVGPKENVDKKVTSDRKALSDASVKRKIRKEQEKIRNNSNVIKSKEKVDSGSKSVKQDKKVEEKLPEPKSSTDAVRLNEVQKLAQEQPPLPLLVKAQSNLDTKEKREKQRDLLDREKRDLVYVTNLTEIDAVKTPPTKDDSNSFVQKIAEKSSAEKVCQKDKKVADDAERKESIQSLENRSIGLANSALSDAEISKPQTGEIRVHLPAEERRKEENADESKISLIMSPSKLSNPELLLQKPVVEAANLKSGELKAIDKKTETRKKR